MRTQCDAFVGAFMNTGDTCLSLHLSTFMRSQLRVYGLLLALTLSTTSKLAGAFNCQVIDPLLADMSIFFHTKFFSCVEFSYFYACTHLSWVYFWFVPWLYEYFMYAGAFMPLVNIELFSLYIEKCRLS